jgi:20S proteasome alpha/beta subunit
MTEAEAKAVLNDCFRQMFYRDKKAHDTVIVSTITHTGGVQMGEPYNIECSSNMNFYYTHTNEFFRPMRIRY